MFLSQDEIGNNSALEIALQIIVQDFFLQISWINCNIFAIAEINIVDLIPDKVL